MKIRGSFVSNSSSSSFILIANIKPFEETVQKCHPFIQFVINQIVKKKKILKENKIYCLSHECTEDPVEYDLNGYTGKYLDDNLIEVDTSDDMYLAFPSTIIAEIIQKMNKQDYFYDSY